MLATAYKKFINAITIVPGNKLLLIDKRLEKLINIVTQHKIKEATKIGNVTTICYLENTLPDFTEKIIICLTIPDNNTAKIISKHMKEYPGHDFHIFFSPVRSMMVEKNIEYYGINCINRSYHFYDFNINLLPVDHDILSMEISSKMFNSWVIDDNTTIPYHIAIIIKTLGHIPKIQGVGKCSTIVASYLKKFNESNETIYNFKSKANIYIESIFDNLILIDRQCDLITPLLSQTSYCGVVYESCPQSFNSVNHYTDNLYGELCHMQFSDVGAHIHEILIKRKEAKDKKITFSIPELTKFTEEIIRIPQDIIEYHYKMVTECVKIGNYSYRKIESSILSSISDYNIINEFIEEAISCKDQVTIYKILSLLSLTGNNINYRYCYDRLRKISGDNRYIILSGMHKFGFFKSFYDDFPTKITQNQIDNKIFVQKQMLNKFFDYYYPIVSKILPNFLANDMIEFTIHGEKPFCFIDANANVDTHKKKKVPVKENILIMFIGGITYDEIQEIIEMSKKKKYANKKITIATTSIINSTILVSSFIDL